MIIIMPGMLRDKDDEDLTICNTFSPVHDRMEEAM